MATKQRLLHNINKARELRKIDHPSVASDWDNISREDQKHRMLLWKILCETRKNK
jgi:hypothetical protein